MMTLSKTQQIQLLAVLVALMIGIQLYQRHAAEPPQTRPLTFERGMKAATPVRKGIAAQGAQPNPLALLLERRTDRYPGVIRDIFRMQVPEPAVKQKPVVAAPPVAVVTAPAVTVPEKIPEEIAAEAARADLSRFRFLGYLTDKDSSLFLSKDGELFIVKSGDKVLKSYQVKAVGKDHVVLYDTITKVEARIELTGSGGK
jgi:hypothetical protein